MPPETENDINHGGARNAKMKKLKKKEDLGPTWGVGDTAFNLDDEADTDRFLDWLCHNTYVNEPSVRLLVDVLKSPRLIVHLNPATTRVIEPAKVNLIVGTGDDLVHVIDDWVASHMAEAPTTVQVRQIVCRFGFSKEQRTLAEKRANEREDKLGR